MSKEIVIAAYKEKINWIPRHWQDVTTIYSCGDFTEDIEHKINYRSPHRHYDQNDQFSAKIDQLREFFYLYKEVTKLFSENEKNQNCEDKLTKIKKNLNCTRLRESNQWLTHIISRYDCLADTTIFLQACPFDHCNDIISIVDAIHYVSFCCLPQALPRENKETMVRDFWIKLNNGIVPEKICWSAGAQFAVSKKIILSKPLDWYKKIKQLGLETNQSGEILERTWWNVLGEPEITKL